MIVVKYLDTVQWSARSAFTCNFFVLLVVSAVRCSTFFFLLEI